MRSYPLAAILTVVVLAAFGVARDALLIWRSPAGPASCGGGTVLVMGAAQYDGRPSPAFARRLDRAAELVEQGCASRVVVSGGRRPGDRTSEGEAGVAYLRGRGIDPSVLSAETAARTSFQNLANSLSLLGDEPIVIVTDDLHAHRTRWLAAALGLRAEMAPVEVTSRRMAYGLRELVILIAYQMGFVR